ncbi:MAG: 2-oxoacid:ferredoxin oxidoreductase subunit gamma [candidate division Zixibacteria bacterium]|nr:2-oxoacid:ferredoxin oxidoreductase subunit gamma [candidate division Zixibacteria bacterium]
MYQGIIVAGFGGQGVVSMGILLAYAGMVDGKHVTFFPAYGAEMRGGTANCSVIVAIDEIASPVVGQPDSVVVMNEPSFAKFEPMIKPNGRLFINTSLVSSRSKRDDIEVIEIPANKIAEEIGTLKIANMVMAGSLVDKTGMMAQKSLIDSVGKVYSRAKPEILKMNEVAIKRGAES